MALIRKVLQNKTSSKWAYIEFSDEDEKVFEILGNKEFDTEGEAVSHSAGFEPDSYEYKETKEIKRGYLQGLIKKAEGDIKTLKAKIKELDEPEPEQEPEGDANETDIE